MISIVGNTAHLVFAVILDAAHDRVGQLGCQMPVTRKLDVEIRHVRVFALGKGQQSGEEWSRAARRMSTRLGHTFRAPPRKLCRRICP
jgi:hypothetical protein